MWVVDHISCYEITPSGRYRTCIQSCSVKKDFYEQKYFSCFNRKICRDGQWETMYILSRLMLIIFNFINFINFIYETQQLYAKSCCNLVFTKAIVYIYYYYYKFNVNQKYLLNNYKSIVNCMDPSQIQVQIRFFVGNRSSKEICSFFCSSLADAFMISLTLSFHFVSR